MAVATPEEMASWPAPNYEDPDTRACIVIGMAAPTLALVIVFAIMRGYGRGVLRHALGRDDWMMLVATIFAIPVTAIALESLNLGLGLHIWDQKEEWHTPYSKMAFAADILFPIGVSLTKISLCLTYLRLFPSQTDKIFCYVLSGFVTLYTVACIFLMLFQCKPIRGYWDSSVDFNCIDMRSTLMSIAGLNSLSDFLVYLWPAKPLWSLQLPKKQKLGLILLFAVGSLVCVAGILRMYYLEVYFHGTDPLWNATPVYALMTLEMNLGIICGCLSGVKPVLAVFFPSLFASSYKTRTHVTPYGYGNHSSRRAPAPVKGTASFPFQPLSDISSSSKEQRTRHLEVVDAEHDLSPGMGLNPEDKEQRNFAWASAGGETQEGDEVPSGAIQVQTVVMRDVENVSPGPKSLRSDGGSEEWIMEDLPRTLERTKQ